MSSLFWVVVASAVLTGFFSLTGYAIRMFRRTKLEEAFAGPAAHDRLAYFERNLTALRLTASFCRALFNLVLVVAMLYLFDVPAQGWQRGVWVTALVGGIIAVFGVGIPHAWASMASEKVLAATMEILAGFRYALFPVIALMQAFEEPIRRLSGVAQSQPTGDERAKQEILDVASQGQATGAVEPEQVRMIASVVAFSRKQAGQVMTPRTNVFAIAAETPWPDACKAVAQSGHTRVPVYEGDLDNIIGVLYAKDLLRQIVGNPPAGLREFLRKPFCVPATKPLDDLLREFRSRKVHMAVVLDEYGGTAGIVSMEDVLEEIVGEIADEFDKTAPAPIHCVGDGLAEVGGRTRVHELNELLSLTIPENADYDTVAGMIFWELGYIPAAGEKLQAHGATFTVLAADERRITKVKVEALKTATQAEGSRQ